MLDEMALERRGAGGESSDVHGQLSELATLFREGRTSAKDIPTDKLKKFSKLFNDVITIDNLTHKQLEALCRLINIDPSGTSAVLNFQVSVVAAACTTALA